MIPFSKYTGAGNDFVVVEDADAVEDARALARALCPRPTGVGVDGMALVSSAGPGGPVGVRFFNPDGSEFAVCGNGTRCAARWAADAGLDRGGELTLATDAGEVEARVDGDLVALEYVLAARLEGPRTVPFGGEPREGWLVSMGTPHFVLPLPELPEGPVDDLCRAVRHHEAMGPEGANVNLVAPAGEGRVAIRTFERGVEAETRACGAGAMSTALALHAAGRSGPELRLSTRGGAELEVDLDPPGDGPAGPGERRIRLSGPARFVFRGRYPWPADRRGEPSGGGVDAPSP